jgi:hypothetical protein
MKLLAGILACTVILGTTLAVEARDKRPSYRKSWSERSEGGAYRRPSTVAPNGTCQRDTGRPFHSLDLNQQCDREEFWARMNDFGNDRK